MRRDVGHSHQPSLALPALLRRQLDAAQESCARADDHSIHAARKHLKRVRAGLRLLRMALGDARYHGLDRRLRDAAAPLRPARDAAALCETLPKLARAGDAGSTRAETDLWRRRLTQELRAARAHYLRSTGNSPTDLIQRGRRQLRVPPRSPEGSASIRSGIRRSYHRGRRACAAARRDPTTGRLHEWRKQVQYLANELGLARALLPLGLRKTQRRAATLAALLGDDHDLALLQERVRPGRAGSPSMLARRIERKRHRLQARAFRLARKLYRRSPHQLGVRLEHALR
jgi:hypothetical protein